MSFDEIATLLGRIALKDRSAFDRLYVAASPKLFAVCLRILSERSEAEDAVQEVFIKIWGRADRYAQSDATAMGWLCAIARNHCIDRVRGRRAPAQPIDEAFDIADTAPGPEKNAINSGEARRIDKCMKELDADKAQAVRAAYVEGSSYEELGQRYRVPINTMRTWLRRSLMKLRECLEQ